MIIVYYLSESKRELLKVEVTIDSELPDSIVWIDVIEPTLEEERFIEQRFDIEPPNRQEIDKIEVLSPFYLEEGVCIMTVTVLHKPDTDYPESTAITFILTSDHLITLRYAKPRLFNYFASRAMRRPKSYNSPEAILEGIIESIVHKIADVLEKTGNELDDLLLEIFDRKSKIMKSKMGGTSASYHDIVKQIGRYGNFISKNRESLVSISRLLIFFGQVDYKKLLVRRNNMLKLKNVSREVTSLSEYANFLSQRNNFLLDATLGMITVEQNMIIKVLTVAAAVFMPPTLIASIYGMNFMHMPEVGWMMGYPFALLMMLVSGLFPYLFFKKRGWI